MKSKYSRPIPLILPTACVLAATILAANAQSTFSWTGGADGNATALLGADGLVNWDPQPATTDYAAGTANIFILASRTGGGPGFPIGNNQVMGLNSSPRMGEWIFDNTSGQFPADLLIAANDNGTTTRALYFDTPDSTAITLTGSVTTRVTIGHLNGTFGRMSLRLPDSGVTTFDVVHPNAVLDFSGTLDNVTGRGGISAGTTTQSLNHARIRKTGAGTLDLRTADTSGNPVLGTIIEGGTVIISSAPQLGWNPLEPMADHVILNGGTLQLVGLTTGPGLNRGFQIGEDIAKLETVGAATLISGVISDVPDEAGVLVKAGDTALRLANANTYSGGTLVEGGILRATTADSFGTGVVSIADGAGISTFGVATDASAPQLLNPIDILGTNVIFGDSGTALVRNTLRLGGDVDLNANDVAMRIDYHTEIDGVVFDGTIPSITARENDHSLVLNADNTFTGSTTVERGGMVVNGSITANLTINRGVIDPSAVGAVGGAGTITGDVTVDGDLRPGTALTNAVGTLNVDGDVTLNASSRVVFEASSSIDIDQLTATGEILIDGAIELALIDGYDPAVDESFQLVDLSGNTVLGPNHSLSLPFLGTSKLWDTSDFLSTGTVTVIAGSVSRNTFTWNGEFPGAGTSLTDPGNFNQWDPEVVAGDFEFGTANTFVLATRPDDPAVAGDYVFTLDGSPRAESFVFDDPAGLFPATINIHANASGTDPRLIWFDLPNSTAISLGENFTSTLRFGGDPAIHGPLGFRLPSSGTTTFHIANPFATLDLGGLLNNEAERGAIHAGAPVVGTDHARIRKTGDGTLDLRSSDPEGNRVLGTTVEGGNVIVGRATELGWNPPTPMADHVVINGGTLRWLGNTVSPGVNRGFQIGGDSPGIEVNDSGSLTIFGVVADIPGHSSELTKTGTFLLTLDNVNTFSGGLRIDEGRVAIAANGGYGTGPLTLGENAGIGTNSSGVRIANNILFEGTTARFGFGTFLNTIDGSVDLSNDQKTFRLINSLVINGDVFNGGITLQSDLNAQYLELNNSNSYRLPTTVDRGRLIVNGDITSDVVVTRGITDELAIGALGGEGTINGSATISGQLRPGTNTANVPGILVLNGDLTLDSTSFAFFEIAGDGINDQVIGLNSALLDGTVQLTLVGGYVPVEGAVFDLIDCALPLSTGPNFRFSLPSLPSGLAWDTGSFTTDGTVSVTVQSADPYQAWATANSLAGTDADRGFDFDKDGFTNLQEFLFGGDPRNSTGSLTGVDGDDGVLTVTYLELANGGSYAITSNDNLAGTWEAATGITLVDPVDQTGVPANYVRKQFTITPGTRDFFRVEATEAPAAQ